jgi:Fe-S-cluster containining protein
MTIPREPLPASASTLPPDLRRELTEAYRRLEEEIRALGAACWAHGDCCDFTLRDHRLYASSAELAYAMESPHRVNDDPALCPFWLDGKCHDRARRPLGCRTYFCDRRYALALQTLYEKYHGEIKALSERHGFRWKYELFVEAVRGRAGGCPRDAPVGKTSRDGEP